jgi:hypothetical protein
MYFYDARICNEAAYAGHGLSAEHLLPPLAREGQGGGLSPGSKLATSAQGMQRDPLPLTLFPQAGRGMLRLLWITGMELYPFAPD